MSDIFNPGTVVRYRTDPNSLGITLNRDPASIAPVFWVKPPATREGTPIEDYLYFDANSIAKVSEVSELVALSDRLHDCRMVVAISKQHLQRQITQEPQQKAQFQWTYRPPTPEEERIPYYGH
jgi:hypothetical protein